MKRCIAPNRKDSVLLLSETLLELIFQFLKNILMLQWLTKLHIMIYYQELLMNWIFLMNLDILEIQRLMVMLDTVSINLLDNGIYAIIMIIKTLLLTEETVEILGVTFQHWKEFNLMIIHWLCLWNLWEMMFVLNLSMAWPQFSISKKIF